MTGARKQYGDRRLERAQLVCDNCNCVMHLDLAELEATMGESQDRRFEQEEL